MTGSTKPPKSTAPTFPLPAESTPSQILAAALALQGVGKIFIFRAISVSEHQAMVVKGSSANHTTGQWGSYLAVHDPVTARKTLEDMSSKRFIAAVDLATGTPLNTRFPIEVHRILARNYGPTSGFLHSVIESSTPLVRALHFEIMKELPPVHDVRFGLHFQRSGSLMSHPFVSYMVHQHVCNLYAAVLEDMLTQAGVSVSRDYLRLSVAQPEQVSQFQANHRLIGDKQKSTTDGHLSKVNLSRGRVMITCDSVLCIIRLHQG